LFCLLLSFNRKWVEIPLQNEFRGFVHNNQFTALSQYFTQLYFPDLETNKLKIAEKILAFYETVKHKLPFRSYVIDFAVSSLLKIPLLSSPSPLFFI